MGRGTLIDDFSRFCEVHLLKNKGECVHVLKCFHQTDPQLEKIRCDNAEEFVSGELARICGEKVVTLPHLILLR